MDRPFGVDDVLGGPTPWTVMVRRGLARRCPRCAGDHLFVTRYRLKDRCPTCGYRFEREPGFFLGSWFINFMVVEAVHFVLVMGFIVWKSGHPEAGLLAPIGVGVATGIALPIIVYPWAQTVWAAIDLAMTPLELAEIIDAADAADAAEADAAGPGPGAPEPPADAPPETPPDAAGAPP